MTPARYQVTTAEIEAGDCTFVARGRRMVFDGHTALGGRIPVNTSGGLKSKGHPVGATGCRIMVTLLHEMQRRDVKLGLATLCVGGGRGKATSAAPTANPNCHRNKRRSWIRSRGPRPSGAACFT